MDAQTEACPELLFALSLWLPGALIIPILMLWACLQLCWSSQCGSWCGHPYMWGWPSTMGSVSPAALDRCPSWLGTFQRPIYASTSNLPSQNFSCPFILQISKAKGRRYLENIWFLKLYTKVSQIWVKNPWCFSPSIGTEVDCVLDFNNLPRYKAIWLRSYLR